MFAEEEAKSQELRDVVSLLCEILVLVLIDHSKWRRLFFLHDFEIQADLFADSFHVLVIEINFVSEPFDCALEGFEINLI